jgi:outer membrane protein OmpA-like peptidoglycan-associated protein
MQNIPVQNATNQQRPSLKTIVLVMLLGVFILQGCAVAVIGIGAGAGAVAYHSGKLTKTYESDYHETIWAATDTLSKLKIPITETVADELKTRIKAQRADGTPVTIEVVRIDRNYNEVSVRTGNVGLKERRVSEQIHSYIDVRLGGATVAYERPPEGQGAREEPAEAQVEQIIEERLDEISEDTPAPAPAAAPAPVQPEASPAPVRPNLEEKRLKAARKLVDSDFHIFFEKDSNALMPQSMLKLDRIYEMLSEDAGARLTLNGYTDSWGKTSYNQMVSELRANAVKSYLVGKGVDPSRMTTVGHGAAGAIASNRTPEGRKFNRRVEIEISTTTQ